MGSKQPNKEVLKGQLKRLADALGVTMASDITTANKSDWILDSYNGYRIETFGGATPFGNDRMTGMELYNTINFALRVIQIDRLNGEYSASYWPEDKSTYCGGMTSCNK